MKKNFKKNFGKKISETNSSDDFKSSDKFVERDRPELYPILFITSLFFIYALSNRIGLGDKTIYEYRIGDFGQKIFNGLRGSGRFIWPVFYLVLGYTITSAGNLRTLGIGYLEGIRYLKFANFLPTLLLTSAFLLQAYDTQKLYHFHDEKFTYCNGNCSYEKWLPIISEAQRVVMYKPYGWGYAHEGDFYEFFQAAMVQHKAITTGYCARPDEATQEKYRKHLHEIFSNGDLGDEKNAIIISNPESSADLVPLAKNNLCRNFIYDGYLITVPNALTKTQTLLAQLPNCKPVTIEKQTIPDLLNTYKNQTIFCVAETEASNKLSDDARKAFVNVGIGQMKSFTWCNTLMAVIHKGRAVFSEVKTEGVYEKTFKSGENLNGYILKSPVTLRTTGNIHNERAEIIISGKKTEPIRRGINFVVVDDKGDIIKTACFDTFESSERVEY